MSMAFFLLGLGWVAAVVVLVMEHVLSNACRNGTENVVVLPLEEILREPPRPAREKACGDESCPCKLHLLKDIEEMRNY